MNAILIAFALLMVGLPFPAVYAYVRFALRSHPPKERERVYERVQPAVRRFAVMWGLVAAAFVLWFALDWTAIAAGARTNLPWMAALGAFHLLWWPFGMPILKKLESRKEAGLEQAATAHPVRVASLKPRKVTEYLSRGERLLPPALAVTAPMVLLARGWGAPSIEPRLLWGACIFALIGYSFLAAYTIWLRFEVRFSYGPIGPDETGEALKREAERLRKFRVHSIFWIEMLGAATFFAVAVLVLEVGRGAIEESTAGLIGGLGGAAVGCAGGVFGCVAGLRGYRFNVMRSRKLEQKAGSFPAQTRAGLRRHD